MARIAALPMINEEFKLIKNGEISLVAEWFKGKHVLVTGATGFLGKVLVERILRVCPPEKLYVMLRPKKGKDIKERLEDFLSSTVFESLREHFPERLSHVVVLKGDILEPYLGLSIEDRKMLAKTCNIIFHSAANVRFDMPLKEAVTTNTLGTKKTLALAKEMENLEVFVHVSTSYCHCERDVLEEVAYPAPHDPNKIIDMVEWMDDVMLEHITPRLLGELPNTYAYSKALSEQLVTNSAKYFPIVIARPSIVVASWQQPIPGWIENLFGPTGIIVAGGKGILRSMLCYEECHADIVPVDICANAFIALAWKCGTDKPKEVMVCNVTGPKEHTITWGQIIEHGKKFMYETPFSLILWYPGGSIKTSPFAHKFCSIFFHFLPAYIIDGLLKLFGHNAFLVNSQKRIAGGLEVLLYYSTKEWYFNTDNFHAIGSWLNAKDRQLLYTDMSVLDWVSYMRTYILGAREFSVKDPPSTVPKARKQLKIYYILHITVKCIAFGLLLLLLWSIFPSILCLVRCIMNYTLVLYT